MSTPRIAFIGGGNMAASLIGGLRAQGLPASAICASDPGTVVHGGRPFHSRPGERHGEEEEKPFLTNVFKDRDFLEYVFSEKRWCDRQVIAELYFYSKESDELPSSPASYLQRLLSRRNVSGVHGLQGAQGAREIC